MTISSATKKHGKALLYNSNVKSSKKHLQNLSEIKPYKSKTQQKILIVEDNIINSRGAQVFFQKMGYLDVTLVQSAREALELFSPKFDLVLLDISLPDMSGIDVCKRMRKILKGIFLPIIAFTEPGESTKFCWSSLGIDDCISKSIIYQEFQRVINYWLRLDEEKTSQKIDLSKKKYLLQINSCKTNYSSAGTKITIVPMWNSLTEVIC